MLFFLLHCLVTSCLIIELMHLFCVYVFVPWYFGTNINIYRSTYLERRESPEDMHSIVEAFDLNLHVKTIIDGQLRTLTSVHIEVSQISHHVFSHLSLLCRCLSGLTIISLPWFFRLSSSGLSPSFSYKSTCFHHTISTPNIGQKSCR